MTGGNISNAIGALITVAMVATLVGSPNTARIATAGGRALANLFLAAQGKRPGRR